MTFRWLPSACAGPAAIDVNRQRGGPLGVRKVVLGISGGLDSTHALIVAARAFDRLGYPRRDILCYALPGFATSKLTKGSAHALMQAFGVTAEEIDIAPSARQTLADIGHPNANGEPLYDVTFENVQAGARTALLFRLANFHDAIVMGTGDLSELALSWCTSAWATRCRITTSTARCRRR
jgi:NAD+ synthase (glutamine-hydrolysing)